MIARDLLDTLISHREICVGMAANMIGKAVRIIVFIDGAKPSGGKYDRKSGSDHRFY